METAKFKPYDRVTFEKYGIGTVIGYVGYEMPLSLVRVEFDQESAPRKPIVRDIHEAKLKHA